MAESRDDLWSIGILLSFCGYDRYRVPQWAISARINDGRFADHASLSGELRMTNLVSSEEVPSSVLRLKQRIDDLGIQWKTLTAETPLIYMDGDGELEGTPDTWEEVVRNAAAAVGWVSAYDYLRQAEEEASCLRSA